MLCLQIIKVWMPPFSCQILKCCSFFLLILTDCAFEFLMNSHKLNTVDQKQPLYSTMMVTCWVCQQCKETMPCAFCEHSVCEMCVRQCDRCFGVFCSFCSTINYDSREDRPLCLTCNAEEFKRQRRWELPTSAAPWNGNILKGSFPQATAWHFFACHFESV